MYRDNYIESLRAEMVDLVAANLSPVARRYGYAEVPLESQIKWRPQVLILGNYSSGKSTLINELLGLDVQQTGQAPTDDCFTIITYDEQSEGRGAISEAIRVTEEREGSVLLNDPQYPFEGLKKHGQRFAAHFRLKKVNTPFLKNLALIDTHGMHDSIAERDRGYNYQDVIGDLAQIADLVLVLFDPHKAGTVREAHASLRDTLPAKTFEDRVLFVLNRVDECETLVDLLRVYGTLCWNLSQMLGRTDIPPIKLTYSQKLRSPTRPAEYLKFLDNQREELKQLIAQAPKYRLDHLAAYVELHGERLSHLLEALVAYHRRRRSYRVKNILVGFTIGVLCAAGGVLGAISAGMVTNDRYPVAAAGAFAAALAFTVVWAFVATPLFAAAFHRDTLRKLDHLTPLDTQSRRDSWHAVGPMAKAWIERSAGKFPVKDVKAELAGVRKVCDKGAKEIRTALNELQTVRHD
jgi:energy-coupling factor transporter ATP-binding protein EcfA2